VNDAVSAAEYVGSTPSKAPILWLSIFIAIVAGRYAEWVPGLASIPLAKVAFLLALVSTLRARDYLPKVRVLTVPIAKPAICFLSLAIISIAFSVYKSQSLNQVYGVIVSLMSFVLLVKVTQTLDDLERLFKGLTVAAGGLALATIFSYSGGRAQINSNFDPNDLAYGLVSILPMIRVLGMTATKRRSLFNGMVVATIIAVLLTGSRGGVLVSLGVMIVTFMIYFGRDMPRGLGFMTALAACIGVGVLLLQGLGGNVSTRIDLQGLSDAGRLSAYHSTLNIIADNPWFGTGLGTFAYAFPAYRGNDISMRGVFDIGHSTPLELASEVGLPLATVVAIAWIVALVMLWRGVHGPRRVSTVPLSALAVALIALLHSSIDFSLQIAGYAIVMFALLGVGLSQAVLSWRRQRDPSREPVGRKSDGVSVNFSS